MANKTRVPSPIDLGREYDFNMETLFTHYQKYLSLRNSGEELDTVTAERYACGYPIPPFQRDLVWSKDQEAMFIESVYLGLISGFIVVASVLIFALVMTGVSVILTFKLFTPKTV